MTTSAEYTRRWREKNPEKAKESMARWRTKNAIKIKAYNKEYYVRKRCLPENRIKERENVSRWYFKNKEKRTAYLREYYKKYKSKEKVKGRKDHCELCGIMIKCVLDVHHIDKDKSNNSMENKITLCANCHRMVHADLLQIIINI